MIFRHLLNMRSHPTWVRGLKQSSADSAKRGAKSHPTWVRGLKHCSATKEGRDYSRTLRGCVD